MPSTHRPTAVTAAAMRTPPPEVTIHHWPLRDRPLSAAVVGALVAAAGGVSVWATGQPALGLIVAILLALAAWRAWLPARYELDGGGVTEASLGWRRRVPWAHIRGLSERRDGVLLLPDEAAQGAAAFRGLYLPWGSQADAIRAHLDYYLGLRAGGRGSTVVRPQADGSARRPPVEPPAAEPTT
jgi:hypothetical protein